MLHSLIVAVVSFVYLLFFRDESLLFGGLFLFINQFLYIFIILYALSFHRIAAIVFWPVILLVTALSDYSFTNYNISIDSKIFGTILEATPIEIKSLLLDGAITSGVFSILLGIAGAVILYKFAVVNAKVSFIFAVFCISSILFIRVDSVESQFAPFNIAAAAKQYILAENGLGKVDISEKYDFIDNESDGDLQVVLIIGESLRSDHIGLNGYKRDTTPLLSLEKNVISYNSVYACATFTRYAVPCFLTRATKDNQKASREETSLISVFASLGYKTSWLGVQGARSVIDSPFLSIAQEADVTTLFNESWFGDDMQDLDVLPVIESSLEEAADDKKLLVIHSFGSHWPYSSRYGKKHSKWQPVCQKTDLWNDMFTQASSMRECYESNPQFLINDYDNSILATDEMISSVINMLKDKVSLLFFISDHGESLGDDGYFLHGSTNREEQNNTAMFVWASNAYIKKNQDKWKNLKLHKSLTVYDSVIFHSVLGCSNIESEAIDSSLDLCDEM